MEVEPLLVIVTYFWIIMITVIYSILLTVVVTMKNILICDNFLETRRGKISYIAYWNLTEQYYSLML